MNTVWAKSYLTNHNIFRWRPHYTSQQISPNLRKPWVEVDHRPQGTVPPAIPTTLLESWLILSGDQSFTLSLPNIISITMMIVCGNGINVISLDVFLKEKRYCIFKEQKELLFCMGKHGSGSKAATGLRQSRLMSQFLTVERIRQPLRIRESRLEYF